MTGPKSSLTAANSISKKLKLSSVDLTQPFKESDGTKDVVIGLSLHKVAQVSCWASQTHIWQRAGEDELKLRSVSTGKEQT